MRTVIAKTSLVGVYGTLKKGYPNHRYLNQSKLVDEGWIDGVQLYDLGPFPAAVKGGENPVYVEVYEVNEDTLPRIDHLEGFNPSTPESSMYIRRQVSTFEGIRCWVYFYNGDTSKYPVLADGVWYG
jgi:gamma-glutamylcyclotransferase (GGCT)/AIG2-like uncharacterized protein YtfP